MRILSTTSVVLLFAALIAGAANAEITNPSAHRKVAPNGVGNCIFSPLELPFQNERAAGYKVTKVEFAEGEEVHVRCYWPKTGSEYSSIGKIWNSIRSEKRFHTSLIWVRPPELKTDSPDFFINSVKTTFDSQWAIADQQRFDIVEAPDCDFQIIDVPKQAMFDVSSPSGCINLADFARAMQSKYPSIRSNTFQFCVQQYVEAADSETQSKEWDRTLGKYRNTTHRNEYRHLIARGCFNYKLSS